MIRELISAVSIIALCVACHSEEKTSEEDGPTFQSIQNNLSAYQEKYPLTKINEADTCTEMKIVSYVRAREKQKNVRDLASTSAEIADGEWVYFKGVAHDFDKRSELFEFPNAKGKIDAGGTAFEAIMPIISDNRIFNRLGMKQIFVEEGTNSIARNNGSEVCGYGWGTVSDGYRFILISDMINSTECESVEKDRNLVRAECYSGESSACEKISEWTPESMANECNSHQASSNVMKAANKALEPNAVINDEGTFIDEVRNSSNADSGVESSQIESFSPSFSCRSASLPSEVTICGDRSLSSLDGELAVTYRSALQELSSPQDKSKRSNMISMQRQWLNERNKKCGADASCLEELMKSRIDELGAN